MNLLLSKIGAAIVTVTVFLFTVCIICRFAFSPGWNPGIQAFQRP